MTEWISKLDWISIAYSAAGSAVFAITLWWLGFFRWIKQKYVQRKGSKNYRKAIIETCSTLIVIGRRQGFSMKQVYISLDIAPSDLMQRKSDSEEFSPQGSYVLVGGPGAGKSTLVRNMVLKHVDDINNPLPFFIRLRDYDGSTSIEEVLIDQARNFGIPDPLKFLKTNLHSHKSLCVLDGLDEVRPALREKVCSQINNFYKKHFQNNHPGTLVVSCRKEAYRSIPLDMPSIWEVRPLTDEQIMRFAKKWPLGYPNSKSPETFWRDLVSSPRILDLVRSPLLLVGGLMQYTESNIGIPEERVEYLARIGKWLVSDWATAQGFPPDSYRSVYPRILCKIALEMHKSERSEAPANDIIKVIEESLPSYGFDKNEAKSVLDSIMTRTGILVRDVPNAVIFAQFGLQEYYASIDSIHCFGIEKFSQVQPKIWWREVILLATAQEKEPDAFLRELFKVDPILASAAVAECPTPALVLRELAINACLKGIDENDSRAQSSAIPLLRKIKGLQEKNFVSDLEKRLSSNSVISSSVGLILATADTTATTELLANYPSIWNTCLQATGFLSSSFEKVLVGWIKSGDDDQGRLAAELLTSRLSEDRLSELLNLLPSLLPKRAEHLAILLLKFIQVSSHGPHGFPLWGTNLFSKISKCIPFINDKTLFLKEFKKVSDEYRRIEMLIPASVFLSENDDKLKEKKIFYYLSSAFHWVDNREQYFTIIASMLSLLSYFLTSNMSLFVINLGIILFLYGLPSISFLLDSGLLTFRIHYRSNFFSPLTLILIGALFVLILGARFPEHQYRDPLIFSLALSIILSINVFIQLDFELLPSDNSLFLPFAARYLHILWTTVLILALISYKFFDMFLCSWLGIFSFILVIIWSANAFRLYIARRRFKDAQIKYEKATTSNKGLMNSVTIIKEMI